MADGSKFLNKLQIVTPSLLCVDFSQLVIFNNPAMGCPYLELNLIGQLNLSLLHMAKVFVNSFGRF